MSPPPISNSKKKLIYKFILVYVTKLCFLIEGLKTSKEQPYCKLLCRPRSELPRHFYRSKMSGAGRGECS